MDERPTKDKESASLSPIFAACIAGGLLLGGLALTVWLAPRPRFSRNLGGHDDAELGAVDGSGGLRHKIEDAGQAIRRLEAIVEEGSPAPQASSARKITLSLTRAQFRDRVKRFKNLTGPPWSGVNRSQTPPFHAPGSRPPEPLATYALRDFRDSFGEPAQIRIQGELAVWTWTLRDGAIAVFVGSLAGAGDDRRVPLLGIYP